MDRLQALLAKKNAHVADARAITDLAETEERELTDEDRGAHAAHLTAIETINTDIECENALRALEAAAPIPAHPAIPVHIEGGELAAAAHPNHGFVNFSQFANAVLMAAQPGHRVVDERLLIGAAVPGSNTANEAVGADGGFMVPPDYAAAIKTYSLEGDALLPLCANDPVTGNTMKIPVDETTPWGTNGIRAYWEGEGAVATQTGPVLEQRELRLRKLFGIVPVSDEILADTAFMSSYLPRKLGESIRYKTNDAIVNGNGTGQPQGFINSGAIVEQAKEGSQTADTINAENVTKMFSRCLDPLNATWLVNPDSWAQLPLMTIGDQPVFLPPTKDIIGGSAGTLFGRPVLMSECAQTLGDAGDIYLAALNWYQTISKAGGGIDFATSMHLWFDYDMTAFRAIFRVDGRSLVRAAVTPPNSAITRSPFVRLAARA